MNYSYSRYTIRPSCSLFLSPLVNCNVWDVLKQERAGKRDFTSLHFTQNCSQFDYIFGYNSNMLTRYSYYCRQKCCTDVYLQQSVYGYSNQSVNTCIQSARNVNNQRALYSLVVNQVVSRRDETSSSGPVPQGPFINTHIH